MKMGDLIGLECTTNRMYFDGISPTDSDTISYFNILRTGQSQFLNRQIIELNGQFCIC